MNKNKSTKANKQKNMSHNYIICVADIAILYS